jgi:dolichol-phosphate mannosyltransferase
MNLLEATALVFPVFNEEVSISMTLKEVTTFLDNHDYSITAYFVNDGSTDSTFQKLKSYNHRKVKIIDLSMNQGYGAALRIGAEQAFMDGKKYVVFLDSDLTNPLSDIQPLVTGLIHFDCVKASRYLPNSSDRLVNVRRRVISRIANVLFKFLFRTHIKDVSNGFRAWNLNTFMKIKGRKSGFDSIMEEFYLAQKLGLRFGELPTTLGSRDRSFEVSSASYSIFAIWNYLKWPLRSFFELSIQPSRRRRESV